jgi:hypothetical protein
MVILVSWWGGTYSSIQIVRGGSNATLAPAAGCYLLAPLDKIILTYTAAGSFFANPFQS